MSTITQFSGQKFDKELINGLWSAVETGTRQSCNIFWSILIQFLKENWLPISLILFIIFVLFTLRAMVGRWGSLGSFLYNLIYFGTLFVIGLIWGPEIFLSDFFNTACAVILYPICYILVGVILDKINVGPHHRY